MQETTSRQRLAGVLILLGLIAQIIGFTGLLGTAHAVSYLLWVAVLLLWRDIPRRSRAQAGVLMALGTLMLLVARFVYGAEVDWPAMLQGNAFVAAMLVGVSFISLIGKQGTKGATGQRVTGAGGILRTWLGVHFLGTILNLSTVFMVGDKLARRGPLTTPQLLALNRGLSSAALWSPFFASMAVVIALVPDVQYAQIAVVGFPMAMLSGLLTTLELRRRFDLTEVDGFSLSPRSLLMPVGMAALVMLFHFWLTPSLTIVSIITFLLPGVAVLSNLRDGPRFTLRRIRQHTTTRLPAMRGEISLFLAAGLLTIGLSTLVSAAAGSDWTLFTRFGTPQAMISFAAITLSALVGLHPIIGVSVLASILNLQSGEQTLFAFVALSSWAVGTSVGPLSGINLSLQGRYGVSGYRMMKNNLLYAAVMSLLSLVAIAGVSYIVG
ncbi:MAG: hypothetical protein M1154_13910 [Gammaproteobacteria bacterium]|uniref:hypothetical protein n=1 Tax=Vreelandella indica TaxID=3126500 RepID=UPI00300E4855|nr:hypothetical protein [Gammaproteobacteria bacterium]|tara:strand:+ start:324 stop:1637 length:1314 start_codon:yes stop_codon:yes gene_type:complete